MLFHSVLNHSLPFCLDIGDFYFIYARKHRAVTRNPMHLYKLGLTHITTKQGPLHRRWHLQQ